MSKIYVKMLNPAKYRELTGEFGGPLGDIFKIDRKLSTQLIKEKVVELAPIQRNMEGMNKEVEVIDKTPETIEFLKKPTLLIDLTNEVHKKAVGEDKPTKTIFLICCLGKVKNKSPASANLCINGASGTGKDFLTGAVLALLPEKKIFARRRISSKALDYVLSQHQTRDWSDYILYLEDVSDGVLNAESVKTLMTASPDKENIVSVVVDGAVKDLKVKGKPVFIFTTAKSKPNEETLRRLPFLFLDESEKQTRAILEKQADNAMNGVVEECSQVSKKFFNGLEKVEVVIPYAKKVQHNLSDKWIKKSKRFQIVLRTVFPRFLDYIKASAALHQHQREKVEEKIIANPEDYENARLALIATTSNSLMIPLSRDHKELLDLVSKDFPEGGTAAQISIKISKWEERWLRANLDRLTDQGFVEKTPLVFGNSDKPVANYRVYTDVFNFDLPSWEEIDKTDINKKEEENEQFNAIGAIGANATSGTIATNGENNVEIIQQNNAIATIANTYLVENSTKKELHQLSGVFDTTICTNCEICGSDSAVKFENQLLCRDCIRKYSGVTEYV